MTMTDLEALSATVEDVGPECQCGCGEFLPAGSTRQFKRGHRANVEGYEGDRPQRPTRISLDEAALLTENDPSPPDQADSKPVIRITKRVRDDIEGKLGMIYGFVAMTLSAKDPICGTALADNAEAIVPKLVPFICKSPELVKWFTKGGGYMAWFELLMVLWPVMQVVIAHHLTHSIGRPEQNGRTPNATTAVSFDQYHA
jgi:hypothetical protein